MRNAFQKLIATLLPLHLFNLPLFAQYTGIPRQSDSKMYVVVAVITAIFAGLVIFLIYLERKLTKLENQIKNHE